MFFIFLEEECFNSLASLVASKSLVFVTQTKMLYEVTWTTVMQICQKHVVRIKNFSVPFYYNIFVSKNNLILEICS